MSLVQFRPLFFLSLPALVLVRFGGVILFRIVQRKAEEGHDQWQRCTRLVQKSPKSCAYSSQPVHVQHERKDVLFSPPRLSNQSKSSRISQGRSLRRGGEPNRGAGGTDTGTVSGVVTHEKCHGQEKNKRTRRSAPLEKSNRVKCDVCARQESGGINENGND